MTKRMICIECPKGCSLGVDIEDCKVVNVRGAKCPKGIIYASAEIENPTRIFTGSVRTRTLALKMAPVRTDKPIPRRDLRRSAEAVSKIVLDRPVAAGETITENFLGLGVKLIATREVPRSS